MKLKKLMMIGLTATTLLTACGSGASTTATEATTEEAPKETTVATAEPASTVLAFNGRHKPRNFRKYR